MHALRRLQRIRLSQYAQRCSASSASSSDSLFASLRHALRSSKVPNALPSAFCDVVNQSSGDARVAFVQQIASMEASDKLHQMLPSLLSLGHGGLQAAMALRDTIRSAKLPAKQLDESVKAWLTSAFATDILQLQRITFESSSGYVLEQIGRGDAVHRIRSLAELKRRLSDGRRVYALFHPALPQKVLAFVNIALLPDIAPSMKYINQNTGELTAQQEADAVCAIFYSITSSIPALSGIDLGTRLIKQASQELMKDHPSLRLFSTLSPIPGFMPWLAKLPYEKIATLLPMSEQEEIVKLVQKHVGESEAFGKDAWDIVLRILQEDYPQHELWHACESCIETLRPILMRLCAHYLTREKVKDVLPLDPVTRFHVRNGAIVHQINWWGNPSQRGLSESAAMMVNYLYDLRQLAKHNEQHITTGDVPTSESVQTLLSS